MDEVSYHFDGAAAWSSSFVACPAGFNAYVAFNMAELAGILHDPLLAERTGQVSTAMDTHLWDPMQRLWRDLAVVGGGPSVTVPISDGVMGALVTAALETIFDALGEANPLARVVAVEQLHLTDYSQHAPYDEGSDALIDVYNQRLREMAARYPAVIPTPLGTWNRTLMIAADTVHPNDQGHRVIADAVCHVVGVPPSVYRS